MRDSSVRLGLGKRTVEEQELRGSDSGSPSPGDIRAQPRQADLDATDSADSGIGQSAMAGESQGEDSSEAATRGHYLGQQMS